MASPSNLDALHALFDTIAQALEPEVRDALAAAFDALAAAVDESHLRAALETAGGDRAKLRAVVDVLLNESVTDAAFAPAKDALRAAFAASGEAMAHGVDATLGTAGPSVTAAATEAVVGSTARVVFNAVNPRAVDAILRTELSLFSELATDARAGLVEALATAVREGRGPADAARQVRPLIGLTEYQVKVIANFRKEVESGDAGALDRQLRDRRFDPTLRKAVAGDTTLTPEQVDRMVEQYAARLKAQSAETIARTESINALKRGQMEAWQQAIDSGTIDRADLVKRWHATNDARTRDAHRAMHGVTVPFDQPWDVPGEGAQMMPGDAPGVYNCRCSAVVMPRFVADLSRNAKRGA